MIQGDIQKLSPGALMEFFVVDMAPIGGGLARFHAGTNELRQAVLWQGFEYAFWPVKADGFEVNGRGQAPRPKITIANVDGTISALNLQFQDLVGAKVVRKRTFARYLDGTPQADPTAEFPDDVFWIERKVRDDGETVEYELASIWDVEGVMLPRRQVIANCCAWQYRRWDAAAGAWDYSQAGDCGYNGAALFDAGDAPTADPAQDVCGKRLSSCKARFGQYAELPYGGFPAAGRIRG